MTSPSSPLSSTSSLTAESIGAPSTARLRLDKLDNAFDIHCTPSARQRRSSSSSSTLTTTTVMLPSDEDRDESDLTEAEDDEPEVELSDSINPQAYPDPPQARESALGSPIASDGSHSDRSSPSLSPAPQSHNQSHSLPAFDAALHVAVENLEQIKNERDVVVESQELSLPPESRGVTPVSDGDDEGATDKEEEASDVEEDEAFSEDEAVANEDVLNLPLDSAPPSPLSNRSQSENGDERPDGEMDVDDSAAEGSGADEDDVSTPGSPLFPSASRSGHTSHAPPPTADAMKAMFLLELKFAALRDQLYIDRMEEAAREEDLILTGLHPAVVYLHATLVHRRERLHADAHRRHKLALLELQRARDAEKKAVANWWLETRESTQWQQYEGNWRKRRRLNREKNELEILRPSKALPPRNPSEKDMEDRSFCWSAGPRATTLSAVDIGQDLTNMGLRSRPVSYSRHASPAYYQSSISGHGNPMMGLYGGAAPKSNSVFSNIYRPAGSAFYPDEGPDYSAQGHQDAGLHRHSNGMSAKHIAPPRLYAHAGYGVETSDAFGVQQHPGSFHAANGTGNSSHHAAQRREGRMVPTTSDTAHIFDVRRRERDRAGRDKLPQERQPEPAAAVPAVPLQGPISALGHTAQRTRDPSPAPAPVPPPAIEPANGSRPSTESPGAQTKFDRGTGVERARSAQPSGKTNTSSSLAWSFADRPYVRRRSNSPEVRRQVIAVESAE